MSMIQLDFTVKVFTKILKEIMLLKVQESKSYREIAEITGLTVTNVGYLVHQALQILRQRLRDLREEI